MVDQVVTNASVLARIRFTIVHIELTVLSLEAACTLAAVPADEVLAGRSILARVRFTLVDFDGAVAARVTFHAVAAMTVAEIFAGSVVTEGFSLETWRRNNKVSHVRTLREKSQ